jgi:hypothetical protein
LISEGFSEQISAMSPQQRAGHPARDGDCEKIRAGISAAAQRLRIIFEAVFRLQRLIELYP